MRLTRPSKGPPEDSTVLRLLAAAAVEVAIVAVVAQGATDALTAVAALTLAPLGYWFSYRQRRRSAVATKAVLAVGLLVALTAFLQQVKGAVTFDEARLPLATLFLWVQVLHAFDVPRRRDLAFSMVSSVILMAEAGSLSFDTGFLLFLLPWAALTGAWLFLSGRPHPGATAEIVSERRSFVRPRRAAAPVRSVGAASLAVLAAATCVFLATPRLPGVLAQTPPFSLRASTPVDGYDGGVSNPGLPAHPGGGPAAFSPTAYQGFGDSVDLRARGRLSDTIVLRVRAPQAAPWRGQVYDTFDGTRWTASDATTVPLLPSSEDGSYGVGQRPDDGRSPYALTHRVVQTFYVQTQQPNVLFTAADAQNVYFPAGGLRVDRYGSIRAPILLDPGLVYSVISQVPVVSVGELRSSSGTVSGFERYLQLPADLPSRDRALAERITAGLTTTYDRAAAVQTWLQTHTEYDLDAPPEPEGVDAVDHFLFETRRGFCEHIASAMVLLLRESGVPARFVVGFGAGERNPLTGYFDVREADAHAWVEVFYPGIGWMPYDPTFGVPNADPSVASRFIAPEVFRAVGRWLSNVLPEPVRRAAVATARAIGRNPLPLVVAAIVVLLVVLRRTARRRRRGRPPIPVGAAAAFATLAEALAATGRLRPAHRTPSEFLLEVAADPGLPPALVAEARTVVRAFERERFSAAGVSAVEVAEAAAAAGRARELAATAPRAGVPR
jgi:transglutaminase-like putative cysteine protease